MQIPPLNMEIDRIYSQILGNNNRSIAINAANPGEGVSSLCLALAQRNLLAGHSTLLVDLNLHRPSLTQVMPLATAGHRHLLPPPQLVSSNTNNITLMGIAAPTHRDIILKLRKPGVLEQCIAHWLEEFDTVIFDTSPIDSINAGNIPPERISAACDGSLFVVLAGHTTNNMVTAAVSKLNNAGARLLGCIINDRDNPPLKQELLREINRLKPRYAYLARPLEKWLGHRRLLALEI